MPLGMSDSEIVQGYVAGKREAVAYIDECIEASFRSWQHRFGYEADDIRSDTRYKLLISFNRSEFAFKASLKTYINRVVKHTCIDYLRFSRRFFREELDELNLPATGLTQEEQLEKRQTARITFRVLRLVPAECRQLWRMYLKGNMKCRQIGEVLGKTEGNIRRTMWACRETAKSIRARLLEKDKPF